MTTATADAFFGIFGMKRVERPMRLDVVVPIEVTRGQNNREHHFARAERVKAEREAVNLELALYGADVPSLSPSTSHHLGARVTLLRPYARTPLDTDNLSGAFKGVRDEVAAFLGVDDKSTRIHWRYVQCPATRFDVDCGQPKCKSVTGKKSHSYCLKCKAHGHDTHIRIRIEIVPAADVDPMATAVRVLREQLLVALSSTSLTIKHSGIDIEGALQVPRDFIRNTAGALATADQLANFDPLEMYNV